jgi:hypothetical protein
MSLRRHLATTKLYLILLDLHVNRDDVLDSRHNHVGFALGRDGLRDRA